MTELARPEDSGYDGVAVLGGLLATVFFPLIALIAALLLQGSQPDPVKRGQLQKWAWISLAYLAIGGILIAVFFYVAFNSLPPSP